MELSGVSIRSYPEVLELEEMDPPEDSKELCNLPDCVKSYIFSKLCMEDLVKISTLSKKWHNEIWGSRMDLNFDLLNMFGSKELEIYKSEFVRGVDNFMRRCRSPKIDRFRLDFRLGNEDKDALDRWISQAISKGVESIELLLFNGFDRSIIRKQEPYEFPCTLLHESGSIKYLHLQNCHLVPPLGFSGFKKLTTLVLEELDVKQDLLQCLFSKCLHLEDLTFKFCDFSYDLKITSPTLHHLKILNFGRWLYPLPLKIDIVASNLSSFVYSGTNIIYSSLDIPWQDRILQSIPEPNSFKKLRTLVLEHLLVGRDRLLCLLSECFTLEELTIKNCLFKSHMHVISPRLLHLSIIDCHHDPRPWNIDIDTLNLSSFEYRGEIWHCSIKAPQLLKSYMNATDAREMPRAFALFANLHQLENLTVVLDRLRMENLPSSFGPFPHLRRLELIIDGVIMPETDFLWVLKIVMASPHLQKLVLKITYPALLADQRPARKYRRFFHNELKYVEFYGFAGNINEGELSSHLLKKVDSLEQITFRCGGRVYIGAGRWIRGWKSKPWYQRWIRGWKTKHFRLQMLQDKDNGRSRFIFL